MRPIHGDWHEWTVVSNPGRGRLSAEEAAGCGSHVA